MSAANRSDALPIVVLDTNAVLDWLVFNDPSCELLGTTLIVGHIRWLATRDMLAELGSVLSREPLRFSPERVERALTVVMGVVKLSAIEPLATATALRCRDADDQKFLDLALSAGARWLLTRDRALLDLRARAHRLRLSIRTPAQWMSEQARS